MAGRDSRWKVPVSRHFGPLSTVRWPDLDLRLLFDLVLSPPGSHSAHVHCYLAYRLVFNVCDLVHSTVTALSHPVLHSALVHRHLTYSQVCYSP